MPLKNDGDKIVKSIVYDKEDYDKLIKLADENNRNNIKSGNRISKLVRTAIKSFLNQDDMQRLIKYTQKELISYFDLNEAILITAAFNGTIYDLSTINPKAVLISNIEDSILFDGFDVLYKVDRAILLNKLNNLSEFQCYLIINMTSDFWNLPHEMKQGDNMISSIKRIFLIG